MSAEQFRKIFVGLEERFGYHIANYEEGNGKKSGTSKTSNYPHTIEMWQAHLDGKKFKVKTNKGFIEADSLGLCPINNNSKCTWGAIDLDNYKPSIPELFKKLKSLNVPAIPFKSKSGGIHLYIFLTEEVPALLMREKLHSIKNIFGVEQPDKIFPVQKYLNLEKGSAGSWINLPYHNAKNTQRYMIKEDGSKATLEEFFEAYEKNKITPSQLRKLKSNIDEGETGDWFKDGPPCMQALAKFGVEKKARNETLLDMTRYIKMRYPENWKDKVGEYNKKIFIPPMGYDEVKNLIGSRDKKDYPYRCDKDWLKPHCDRDKCILRKFGVGGAATNEVVLGPLSYVKSTPVIWYLGFNGEEVRLSSKEIVKQDLAREAATDQIKKTPPKTKNWDEQIRALQVKATPIDAPEESQPILRLKAYLENFCFNLRQTTKKKQLLFNRPYHEDGKVRFIFEGFFKYLKTNDWNIGEDLTHQMLKKMKALSREKFHIEKNNKKWVYVLDEKLFKKEEMEPEQDRIDFGQDTEVPY
jgi:hypothetical protein